MLHLNILYMCITVCLCIGVDYYYEDDPVMQQYLTLLEGNISLLLNKTYHKSIDENDTDDSKEVRDIYYVTKDSYSTTKTLGIVRDDKEFHNSIDSDHRKMFKNFKQHNQTFSINPSQGIFHVYEYIYDDERYQTHDSENENDALLSGRKQKQRMNYNTSQHSSRKLKKHKMKKMNLNLLDYYSLEPASVYVTYNTQGDRFTEDNETVWYVPQDIPCWQLPLLYGELGYREKKSNLFSINRAYVKNVVRKTNKNTLPKISQPTGAQIFNKWCGIEPCYGDHTLCLFPEKIISGFCEKGYNVKTPTISEQIALVNTLNSMRNRVASGESIRYSHLPQAANMMQVTYDFDLEKMAYAWLSQCLPGPSPCSSLDGSFVSQLECKKYMKQCCLNSLHTNSKCIPLSECFILAVVGCLHTWYWSAGESISETDIQCGHIEATTFNTVQLIWANTHKIGCAFGVSSNSDVRVVCNFSPGAPYFLKRKLFCGLLPHRDITHEINETVDITNLTFLSSIGINLDEVKDTAVDNETKMYRLNHEIEIQKEKQKLPYWGVDSLSNIYEERWVSSLLGNSENGTKGMLARVVTQFIFYDENQARCDTEEPIYVKGKSASLCIEKGKRYPALCYHFGDPTPGYRLVAIFAPVTLFSLILYDLFSAAVRQTVD